MSKQQILPKIYKMLEFKNTPKHRKMAAEMVVSMAKVSSPITFQNHDQEFILNELLGLIQYACQDQQWPLRKVISDHLGFIATKLDKPAIQEYFYNDVSELNKQKIIN